MAFLPVAGLAAVALRDGCCAARLIHRHRPRSPTAPGRAGLPARYVDTIPTQSMLQERQKGTRRPRRRATPGMVQTNRPPTFPTLCDKNHAAALHDITQAQISTSGLEPIGIGFC